MSKYGNPYFLGGSDDLEYELYALDFVNRYRWYEYSLIRGNVTSEFHNSVGYVYFISLIIRLGETFGGYHTMMPRLINLFILVLFCQGLYRLCNNSLNIDRRDAYYIIILFGFNPFVLYISSHIYRDLLIGFLFFCSIYFVLSYRLYFSILVVPFLSFLVYEFRQMTAVMMLFISPMFWVFKIKLSWLRSLILLISIVPMFFFVLYFDVFDRLTSYSDIYTNYRMGLAEGLSSKIFSLPLYFGLPLRVLYYFLTPIPVFYLEFDKITLMFSTFLQCVSLPIIFLGIKRVLFQKENYGIKLIIFTFSILLIGLAATSFSIRHMIIFYPYWVISTVYIYQTDNLVRNTMKRASGLLFIAIMLIVVFYFLYKVLL
ncbi:hypothetical protein [Vibrio sp. E14]|uniref:hypothetical protein n=1 Tax=Vibrio sp. E14 TaxID=2849869 RepID=UPI001CF81E88|nr:hypothetical protein [Vibrio sp. E14]